MLRKEKIEEYTETKVSEPLPYSEWVWEDIKKECKNRNINVVGKKKEAVYMLMEEWDKLALKGKLPNPTPKEEEPVESESTRILEQLKCFLIKFKQDEKLVNEIKQIINE